MTLRQPTRCVALTVTTAHRCHNNASHLAHVRRRGPDAHLCGPHWRIYQRYGYQLGPHSLRLAQ